MGATALITMTGPVAHAGGPSKVARKAPAKTQAALRDFQSQEGLNASGRLDAETMSKLGIEAKTGAAVLASRRRIGL